MTLDAWLNYIAELHASSIDLGLSRITPLVKKLGLQRFACPVVMVGGTNGKGSVVRTLELIHLQAGLRVAAYTSPHLFHFNERLRINNAVLPDEVWVQAFARIEVERQDISLSFFEFTTLAALLICQSTALDLLILEVGLGGRLDAVNTVEADVAVVTNVDLDHQDWLGDTREKIAFEKAGIFRSRQKAVCGDPEPPVSLLAVARELDLELYCINRDYAYLKTEDDWVWQSGDDRLLDFPEPQLKPENVATALMATKLLALPVSDAAMRQGVAKASLPGRYETMAGPCPIIFDVAHNPQSAQYLLDRFHRVPVQGRRYAVVGMLKDKDILGSLSPFCPCIDEWYVGSLTCQRGASSDQLTTCLHSVGAKACQNFSSVTEAFRSVLTQATPLDAILVFGSFHTVAEAKRAVTGDM